MATARDWILVLYGRFIRERAGWISVAQLIELLEPLGADAASIRTAVSRMKRAGMICAEVRDDVAGYSLTPDGEAFFADGDRRVLERTQPSAEGSSWVLASFSVPESHRKERYKIRALLLDLGFGQESSGLLIAPVGLSGEAERALRREALDGRVSLWIGEFGRLGSISDVVGRSWDIASIQGRYELFIESADAALSASSSGDSSTFVEYLTLVNDWRELAYLDPGLPAAALGDGWPQPDAVRRFEEVEEELRPSADRHYDDVATGRRRRDGHEGVDAA